MSNELGYGRPRTARLAVIVVVFTSLLLGLFSSTVLLVYKKQYPIYFTSSQEVIRLVEELTLLLGVSTIGNSMQSVLSGKLVTQNLYHIFIVRGVNDIILVDVKLEIYVSGVAIGAGWQTTVVYMNIASYFIVGIPLGLLLGFKFNMGVKVRSYLRI